MVSGVEINVACELEVLVSSVLRVVVHPGRRNGGCCWSQRLQHYLSFITHSLHLPLHFSPGQQDEDVSLIQSFVRPTFIYTTI